MNHAGSPTTLTLNFTDVPHLAPPGASGYAVRDLNAHAALGVFRGSFTTPSLPAHDSAFLTLTPAP